MSRLYHFCFGAALALVAAVPAVAGTANVRLSIRLEASAAMLRCPACIAGEYSTAVAQAVSTLSVRDAGSRDAHLSRFLSHGVRIGRERFAGLSVELRRETVGPGVERYLVL